MEAGVAPIAAVAAVERGTPAFLQIADQLIKLIETGELPVGSRLPPETVLSEMFNVSRPSVREALSSLQFAGYIEPHRGSGTIVRSSRPQGTGRLPAKRGLRKPADIVDLLGARLVIEPEALGEAARDPAPGAMAGLASLLEGMKLAVGRPELRAHTDLGIHLQLARACRNRFLADASEGLIRQTDGTLWRSVRDRAWQEGKLPRVWLGHHETLVRSVTEHDSERAFQTMRVHLLSVLGNFAATTPLTDQDRARVRGLQDRYGAS